jgi:cysteine dioxygenase type I
VLRRGNDGASNGTVTAASTIDGMPATAPTFVPARASLDDLVPHGGILDPEELETIARGIAARPDLWQPLTHADTERRRYELVYEDERMDAWVLSWMPGQATGFHDHYISSLGLCVAQGCVREDQMRYGADPIERRLSAGDSRRGDATYLHRVRHWDGSPAVTIHVYSPRLDWVGQYRLGDDGVIRREPSPGRNELRPQLLSEGALDGVLERF